MKSSDALKAARVEVLKARGHVYLCNLLGEYPETGVYLRLKALMGGTTLTIWLRQNVPEANDFFESIKERFAATQPFTVACESARNSKAWMAVLKAYRLAWIDELIAEYEAKGD